jgi:hypothetical protein
MTHVRFWGGPSGSGRARADAELCHIPGPQHTKAETGDPQSSGRCPAALGVKPSRLTCRPVDLFRTRQLTPQALRGNHHVPFAGSVAPFSGRATSRRSCASHHHSTHPHELRCGSSNSRSGSHRSGIPGAAAKKGQAPVLRGTSPEISTKCGDCVSCYRGPSCRFPQQFHSGKRTRGHTGGNPTGQDANQCG